MTHNKHVLIFAYHYIPENTSGVQRVRRMCKFMPDNGYTVSVITTSRHGSVEGNTTDRWVPSPESSTASRRLSTALTWLQRVLPYNDQLPWTPYAIEAARRLNKEKPVDAMISTSPPLATHLAAWRLKRSLGIPWVADFRDPLIGNPTRHRKWGKPLDIISEKLIVTHADAIVTVTDVIAEEWKRRYPRYANKMRVMWNGFDPDEEVPLAENSGNNGARTLTHAGVLYSQRHPWKVLESLDRLTSTGRLSRVLLKLIGPVESYEEIKNHPVIARLLDSGCLQMDGEQVSRIEALRLTSESDYLLLLDILNLDQVGYAVPAKVFDYLAWQANPCANCPALAA
jgi:glycosyltransferase involved in cell wall biosynthesis